MYNSTAVRKDIINVISWQDQPKSIDIDDIAKRIRDVLTRKITEELYHKGIMWPSNGLDSERWVMLPNEEEIKEWLMIYLTSINRLQLRRISQESVSRIEALVRIVEQTSGGVKFYTPGIDREPVKVKDELR